MNYRRVLTRRAFLRRISRVSIGATLAVNSMGFFGLVNAPKVLSGSHHDFRALVLVFLEGGNDSFNMIVPSGTGSMRAEYDRGRRFLALPNEQLQILNLQNAANLYDGSNGYGPETRASYNDNINRCMYMTYIAQKNPNINFKFVLPRDQNKIHTINSNNVTGMYYEKFDPGMRS